MFLIIHGNYNYELPNIINVEKKMTKKELKNCIFTINRNRFIFHYETSKQNSGLAYTAARPSSSYGSLTKSNYHTMQGILMQQSIWKTWMIS